MPRTRRALATGLATVAAVAASLTTGAGSAGAITGIPTDCTSYSTYLNGDRTYGAMLLEKSRVGFVSTPRQLNPLTWTPAAHHVHTAQDEGGRYTERGYMVSAGGTLQRFTPVVSTDGRTERLYRKLLRGGWSGTRATSPGHGFVYALQGDRLVRWRIASDRSLVGGTTLGTGYADLKTLSYAASSSYGDTLIATSADGSLQRIKISYNVPTQESVTTLRSTGFADAESASAGSCGSGRDTVLLTAREDGRIYAYHDKDGWDRSAYSAKGYRATSYVLDGIRTYSN